MIMKKHIAMVLSLVMVFGIVVSGCSKETVLSLDTSETSSEPSQTSEQNVFIPEETSSTASTFVDPGTGETVEIISTLPDGTPDETRPTTARGQSNGNNNSSATNPTNQPAGGTTAALDTARTPDTTVTSVPTTVPGTTATVTPKPTGTSYVTPTPYPTSSPKPTVTVKPTNTPTPAPSGNGTWQDSKADEVISILNQKRHDRAVRLGTATWYVPYQKSSSFTNSAKQLVLKGFSANGDDKFIFSGDASASTIASSIDPYLSYTKKIKYVSVGFGIYYNNGKTYVVMIQQEGPSGEPSSSYHITPNKPATPTPTPKPTNTPTPAPTATNTPTPKPTNTPTPKPTEAPSEQPDDSGDA